MAISNIRDKLDGSELDLSMMSLKEVPLKDIASVPRATVLDLSSNLLKGLPPSFGAQLTHIVKLDLSANKLQSLPKTFHQLINLKHLDLYSNQLTDLPVSLHHLVKLRFLDIKNNPLNPTLKIIVGDCLTRKECENAAKSLLQHYNKEKQLAIDQAKMANKTKVEEQHREQETVRNRNEKKTTKKERKPENNKPAKQQQHQDNHQQKSSNNSSSNNKSANGSASRAQRVNIKAKAKSGSSYSCYGLLNFLLFATVLSAAAWCLHLHVEGDYSQAGLQAAVPRLQKSFLKIKNITVEALQPGNLHQTSTIVLKSANATAYEAASAVKKAAYAGQAYLEVYTGDLTPYTSKVSHGASVVSQFMCAQLCAANHWLMAQDWQGMWNACVKFLTMVWKKLQEAWTAALQHPTVAAAWAGVCQYCTIAAAYIVQLTQQIVQYLQSNVPIWLELVRDNTYHVVATVKNSVESMLK